MWNLMEYHSAQYKPGHMTANMETIIINKGRKTASDYAYNQVKKDWLSSTHGCEGVPPVP